MNTVKKGDLFEARAFQIINAALIERRLGLHSEYCRVHQKPAYYSRLREGDIIFDLSIEVWPPNADRCHLLYLIECKDYSGAVPVSDIEEFTAKIQQVAGHYVKGVFVTNGDVQESGLKLLRNLNFMFIKVKAEKPEIILYNKGRKTAFLNDLPIANLQADIKRLSEIRKLYQHQNSGDVEWDKVMFSFLNTELNAEVNWQQPGERGEGLEHLSKKLITSLTEKIINEFDPSIIEFGKSFPLANFMVYLTRKYGLKFITDKPFKKSRAHLNGFYDRKSKVIHINPQLCINQFAFVCGHEIGHFFLHNNLQLSQDVYDTQTDSKYDPFTDKHLFEKEKHWIEWQANYFAGCLIMPHRSLLWQLITWQKSVGLSKRGYLWLDSQPCNILYFKKALTILGFIFEVSRSILEIRMSDLGIIKYQKKRKNAAYAFSGNATPSKSIYEILLSRKFSSDFEDDDEHFE